MKKLLLSALFCISCSNTSVASSGIDVSPEILSKNDDISSPRSDDWGSDCWDIGETTEESEVSEDTDFTKLFTDAQETEAIQTKTATAVQSAIKSFYREHGMVDSTLTDGDIYYAKKQADESTTTLLDLMIEQQLTQGTISEEIIAFFSANAQKSLTLGFVQRCRQLGASDGEDKEEGADNNDLVVDAKPTIHSNEVTIPIIALAEIFPKLDLMDHSIIRTLFLSETALTLKQICSCIKQNYKTIWTRIDRLDKVKGLLTSTKQKRERLYSLSAETEQRLHNWTREQSC